MKLFFSSTLSKVLAAILALFMPLTTLTPAIHKEEIKGTRPFVDKSTVCVEEVKNEENDAIELEEMKKAPEQKDEAGEATPDAPAANPVNDADADKLNDAAPAANEDDALANLAGVAATGIGADDTADAEDGNAPLKTWDISATDNDDVKMYYYPEAEEENENPISNVLGAIRALFVPMVALAAEDDVTVSEHAGGKVVITGRGATEEMIFLNWLDADLFVPYYEAWCANHDIDENEYYIIRTTLDDYGNETADRVSAEVAHANAATNTELLEKYLPAEICYIIKNTDRFWETYATFNPTEVEIINTDNGVVTKISFAAFALCTNLEKVTFNTGLVEIGASAFSNTAITEVRIPGTVEIIGESAFTDCVRLAEVYIPASVDYIGTYAFHTIAANSVIYCENEDVEDLFYNAENDYSAMAISLYGKQEIPVNYIGTDTALRVNPALF